MFNGSGGCVYVGKMKEGEEVLFNSFHPVKLQKDEKVKFLDFQFKHPRSVRK